MTISFCWIISYSFGAIIIFFFKNDPFRQITRICLIQLKLGIYRMNLQEIIEIELFKIPLKLFR